VDQFEAQVKTLQNEKRLLEDQVSQLPTNEGLASLQATICQLETQVQALQYEKSLLEDQISQLPSIDAFKSLQIINEDAKLQGQSKDDYNSMVEANEDLKIKLNSIGIELEASKVLFSSATDEKQATLYEESKQKWDKEKGQLIEKLAAMRNKAKVSLKNPSNSQI
jgi:hypothetical protein